MDDYQEADGVGIKRVMSQIEQLIQGLLASHERRLSNPMQVRAIRSRNMSQASADIPHMVPELRPASPDPTPNAPNLNPKTLRPQTSQISVPSAVQPTHSRQVTPSDEGSAHGDNTFRLHVGWVKRQEEQGSYRMTKSFNNMRSYSWNFVVATQREGGQKLCPPDWKGLWVAAAFALILFDCISIPLLAFSVREPWAIDLIRVVFWTLSMPSFLRMSGGLCSFKGAAEVVLEITLVILVFVGLVQAENLSTRTQFVFRGPELLRLRHARALYHLGAFPRFLVRWNRGELRRLEVRAAANLIITLMVCFVGVHLLTCTWFAAGRVPDGWATDAGLLEQPVWEQYRRTLEFALSRIPPSKTTDNIMLTTQMERGIALTATAMALLFGSIFTSIVTNDMSDIRRVRRQQGEADCQLSDFLETFPVSWSLERQLKDYLKQTVKRVSLPTKHEMHGLLPDLLYAQLCCQAFSAVVGRHQMFSSLMAKYPAFQHDLCVKSLTNWTVAPNEVLFSGGLSCQSMLFVAYNFVLYKANGFVSAAERSNPGNARTWSIHRHNTFTPIVGSKQLAMIVPAKPKSKKQTGGDGPSPVLRVTPGHWMCEACLWTPWTYLGQAVAGTSTSLLCLSHSQLLSISAGHSDISAELVIHARLFLNALNDTPDEQLNDVATIL